MARRTPIKLKGHERLKLYDWLRLPTTRTLIQNNSVSDLTKKASKILGFKIAPASVTEILDYLGFKPGGSDIRQWLQDLETRVSALERRK